MRIAIIGCGNLGSALVRGFAQSSDKAREIVVFDPDEAKLRALESSHGVVVTKNAVEAAANAEVVVCAVKPKQVSELLSKIRASMEASKNPPLLISVAAGVSVAVLKKAIGTKVRVVRVMPNVACLIGEGLTGIFGESAADTAVTNELFLSVGETILCAEEAELNVVTALAAGGPAFIYVVIEALAEGGVRMGLTREESLRMAAGMTRGAALLMLKTGKHPDELKKMVASPGGTTVAGLDVLEQREIRDALASAVEASTKRALELLS